MSWASRISDGGDREVLRPEPPVIGDDHALRLLAALDDVAGDAVGAATDGVEREVLGDPGPPAVRAEDDPGRGGGVGHEWSSQRRTRSTSASTAPEARRGIRSKAVGVVARIPRGPPPTTRRPPRRSMTRSFSPASAGSFALTTRPEPAAPIAAEERGPRAEVVPADVHRGHDHLAVARRALHHGVVDGDRPCLAVGGVEPGFASTDRLEQGHEAGIPFERVADCRAAPGEDPRVPEDLGHVTQDERAVAGRLLLERVEERRRSGPGRRRRAAPRDQVAVLGRGPIGLDAQGDERRRDAQRAGREAARQRRGCPGTRLRPRSRGSAGSTT